MLVCLVGLAARETPHRYRTAAVRGQRDGGSGDCEIRAGCCAVRGQRGLLGGDVGQTEQAVVLFVANG